MLSQAIVEFGKPLQAIESPTPEPKGTEVLLKVENAGVCHSDVHIHDGYFDLGGGKKLPMGNLKLPHTLGPRNRRRGRGRGARCQGRESRPALRRLSLDRLRRLRGLPAQ